MSPKEGVLMTHRRSTIMVVLASFALIGACSTSDKNPNPNPNIELTVKSEFSEGLYDSKKKTLTTFVTQGKNTFRYDTFGSEHWFGDTLRLHEAVAQAVSPKVALSVG